MLYKYFSFSNFVRLCFALTWLKDDISNSEGKGTNLEEKVQIEWNFHFILKSVQRTEISSIFQVDYPEINHQVKPFYE